MDLVAKAWRDAFEPPDDREIYDWGRDFIDLPAGGYAIPGMFEVLKSRHLLKPFEALRKSSVRIVSFRGAVQIAKSLLSDIWIPNTLANNPGPTLLSMQTEEVARDHFKVRLLPVIKGCRPLQRLVDAKGKGLLGDQIIFTNGVPLYVRGPALSNAQSKSIRYLSMDELWILAQKFPGRIREFMARTSAYDVIGNSKTLATSQGGDLVRDLEGNIIGDEWALLWHQGNQSWWQVHCLHCRHLFVPHWTIELPKKNGKEDRAGMKWDDNGGQVRYECPRCRKGMIDTDATKAEWNAHGDYVITNPGVTDHESFTAPAWITAHWEPLVKEFLSAMQSMRSGLVVPLKLFLQKKAGVDWEERKQLELPEAVIATGDFTVKTKRDWADEKYRFMSVDCQANLLLFYVVIRAWSSNGESRRIFRGRFDSWEAVRRCQEEFEVDSKFVGVDSGYEATKVYRQCCRHVDATGRGWCAFAESDQDYFTHHFKDRKEKRIYGERQLGDPLLGGRNEDARRWLETVSEHAAKLYQRGQLKCPVYQWSRESVSDILSGLVNGKGPSFASPKGDASDAEERLYRQQMAGEIKKMKRDKLGRERMQWVVIAPNHYWSCEKINIVQACLAGVVSLETVQIEPAA